MPTHKPTCVLLTICLCLALSACKVITPTPPVTEAAGETSPEPKAVTVASLPERNWYVPQANSPAYIPNATPIGCNWMGVAGQAFSKTGTPLLGYKIVTGGEINGQAPIDSSATTGGSPEKYGPGGYELDLTSAPVASNGTVWVQLQDATGNPLSDKFYFATYGECEKNLIIINYYYIGIPRAILPLISR